MLSEEYIVDPFRMRLGLRAERGGIIFRLLFAVVNVCLAAVSKIEV